VQTNGQRIGVIGSGVAGLTAAYLLQRLFGELGVSTQDTEMSMSIRCDGCGLEYTGAKGVRGMFAQPRNLARGKYLRMLAEVKRFHVHANRVLRNPDAGDVTIGAFLVIGGYTKYFADHFMLPVVSTVWSAERADTPHRVDRVVVATHADQALRLLAEPTAAEHEVLSPFRYSGNEAWLHTDAAVLPKAAAARAGWNFTASACGAHDGSVQVSYDMNRLMRLEEPTGYVVTLNPSSPPPAASVIAKMDYEHPVYTPESVAAQRRLPELNDGVVAFAGAYQGWGFHEDGCASGVRAAESFGVRW